MSKSTPKDRCDFCKVRHEQVRRFRRVVCAKTGKFVTVWREKGGVLYCAKTGERIIETCIKTDSRTSYYIWSERKAKVRLIEHEGGIKTACEHCYNRERKKGNYATRTRPKTRTNSAQPSAENALQSRLFT